MTWREQCIESRKICLLSPQSAGHLVVLANNPAWHNIRLNLSLQPKTQSNQMSPYETTWNTMSINIYTYISLYDIYIYIKILEYIEYGIEIWAASKHPRELKNFSIHRIFAQGHRIWIFNFVDGFWFIFLIRFWFNMDFCLQKAKDSPQISQHRPSNGPTWAHHSPQMAHEKPSREATFWQGFQKATF